MSLTTRDRMAVDLKAVLLRHASMLNVKPSCAAAEVADAINVAVSAAGLGHLGVTASYSASSLIVALLKRTPRLSITLLTYALYGKESTTLRARTRALLSQLGRLGHVRRVDAGAWEAT